MILEQKYKLALLWLNEIQGIIEADGSFDDLEALNSVLEQLNKG